MNEMFHNLLALRKTVQFFFVLFLSLKEKLDTYNEIENNCKGLNFLLKTTCKVKQAKLLWKIAPPVTLEYLTQ